MKLRPSLHVVSYAALCLVCAAASAANVAPVQARAATPTELAQLSTPASPVAPVLAAAASPVAAPIPTAPSPSSSSASAPSAFPTPFVSQPLTNQSAAIQPLAKSGPLTAAPAGPSAPADPNELKISGLGGGSAQWTIVVLLTFLTLIPSILICMTPFARLLIVFHFLRQALGLQTTPSNQTLVGLSLIMTFFLMQPVAHKIYDDSVVPLQQGKVTAMDALVRGTVPMRDFMSHYVREKDVAMFLDIAKEPRPSNINDISFRVLLPAYILSELKAGFQIGAVLFLPFLVIDMVVASITTSVGMMQLPPTVISTPLKLMLFLMVDGWHLLIGALMRSFS